MKLQMELGKRSYDIIVKRGALGKAGQLANLNRKVMIVTDEGVPEAYVKTLAAQCGQAHVIRFPQGEPTKSIANWESILARMLELNYGRTDAVAAVGGGVVGDLAGFAAAAYMRGVAFFQFPTTTLSQIDSSIGGKVAVNLGGTKNIIGAFHQPRLVVADPDTLATLPRRQFANGMAEALKTGLIGSTPLFQLMEEEAIDDNVEQILYYALRYKKGVVERDETEQGERKLLNFGHTIGHGLEAATAGDGENELLHGECVALGMLPMLESRALVRRTRAVMRKLGLPLKANADPDRVLHYMQSDKKRKGAMYTVVRVKTTGQGYLEDIPFEELELMVRELVGAKK